MTFHNNLSHKNLFNKLKNNKNKNDKDKNKNTYFLVKMINGLTYINNSIIENIVSQNINDEEIYKLLRKEYLKLLEKNNEIKDNKDNKDKKQIQKKEEKIDFKTVRAIRMVDKVSEIIQKNKITFNNKVFVDIGCGDGSITKQFCQKYNFDKCICVDIDNWLDTYTSQKEKGIELVIRKSNENIINLSNDFADVIMCFHSLHHMANLHETLQEIARITKKNGLLIIKEHNVYYPDASYMIDIYHAIYELVFKDNNYEKFNKEYYSQYFSDKETYSFLKKLGYEIINYTYDGGPLKNYIAIYKKV